MLRRWTDEEVERLRALVARDGALMLAGFVGTAAAFSVAVFLVPWNTVAGWF